MQKKPVFDVCLTSSQAPWEMVVAGGGQEHSEYLWLIFDS